MKRTLLVVIGVAALGATLVSTGAFVDVPGEGSGDIEMQPSDGPNAIYAVENEDEELALDLSEDNQQLAAQFGGKGVNDNSITRILNIFTVTYTDDNADRTAEVWLETDIDGLDVEFIEGLDQTNSIHGEDESVALDPGERLHVGIVVDTTGEHAVEELSEFTLHAERPELEDDRTSLTPGPGDDGPESDDGDGEGTGDDEADDDTEAGDETDDTEVGDETDEAKAGDETDDTESGDETDDEGETEDGESETEDDGSKAGNEDADTEDNGSETANEDAETEDNGSETEDEDAETEDEMENEDGETATEDGTEGEIEDDTGTVGTVTQPTFPGPEETLGGFFLRTLLLLIVFVVTGAGTFAVTRYGLTIPGETH